MKRPAAVVDPNLPVPLYHQLKSLLLERIRGGNWPPGFRIPTETELIQLYSVSRTTVREAVSALVQEGYLVKKQGKGTFVREPRLEERLGRLTGFAEEMIEQGYVPSAELLGVSADMRVDRDFRIANLPDTTPWVKIERLRLADGHPVAIERSFWPADIADILCAGDLSNIAYYTVLERNGIWLRHAEEDIAAVSADKVDAARLGVKAGIALIQMQRWASDSTGRLIEYTVTRYRGDRYTYHVHLDR